MYDQCSVHLQPWGCKQIHRLLLTILRGNNDNPTAAAAEIFELLSRLDDSDKRIFWDWLSEHDSNLKRWLRRQGRRRAA